MECPKCGGSGFIDLGKTVKLCDCRFSSTKALQYMQIPPRFLSSSFENYIPISDSQRAALSYCIHFCETYNPKRGDGINIIGKEGTGKTHLAVSILKHLYLKKMIRGLFVDTKTLLYRLQIVQDRITYKNMIEPILSTEVVVLDDLGSQTLPDWKLETLSMIINYRYNMLRPTIITSLYPLKSENSHIGTSLEDRLPESIISKLSQANETIRIL